MAVRVFGHLIRVKCASSIMIPVNEAIEIVLDHTPRLPTERVSLANAMGRFLAEDIVADSDLPPFDRAQMDGYALRAEDTLNVPVRLRIVGESAAGKGWHNRMAPGEAVRIMTGAPVPAGADSVQQVELTREVDGETVEILESVFEGRSIVRRAAEIERGNTVLRAGQRINAAMMAVLAAFGYDEVLVTQRPKVAVLATGSELVPVDQKPDRDQIRDSNNYSIAAYAEVSGAVVERLPLAHDDPDKLKLAIAAAAERSDVVITSGGVSMGVYDFTKAVLKELGAGIFFERVALRPGKPTVFGKLSNGTLLFGLPGNPVSVAVTFNLFARTALLALQGAGDPHLLAGWAIIGKTTKGSLDRESYLPAQLTTDEQGRLIANPLKWGGSSDFVAFARTAALIDIPAGVKSVQEGEVVRIVKLPD
jgi:molybdenum cofactor synthesis domain-containing protein